MVGRVGFEPTVDFRRWIMSPVPATITASDPELGAASENRTRNLTLARSRYTI